MRPVRRNTSSFILSRVIALSLRLEGRAPPTPEREALQVLVTESQRDITGVVRLKLYKGNMIVAGRKSPKSLYDPKIATMEGDGAEKYDQSDATGFIRLSALRLKVRAARKSLTKK